VAHCSSLSSTDSEELEVSLKLGGDQSSRKYDSIALTSSFAGTSRVDGWYEMLFMSHHPLDPHSYHLPSPLPGRTVSKEGVATGVSDTVKKLRSVQVGKPPHHSQPSMKLSRQDPDTHLSGERPPV